MGYKDASEAEREKRREYASTYYKANREKILVYYRAYYASHKKKYQDYSRAYYDAHRGEKTAYMREYYRARRIETARTGEPDALRRSRKAHGYTQTKLAELCGVSPSAVSRWESGELRYDPKVVGRWLPELLEEGKV